MKQKSALTIIFVVALVGVVFSGVLTYREFFGAEAVSCPTPGALGTVFGYPACVYGLFMYLFIAVISGIGIFGKRVE